MAAHNHHDERGRSSCELTNHHLIAGGFAGLKSAQSLSSCFYISASFWLVVCLVFASFLTCLCAFMLCECLPFKLHQATNQIPICSALPTAECPGSTARPYLGGFQIFHGRMLQMLQVLQVLPTGGRKS